MKRNFIKAYATLLSMLVALGMAGCKGNALVGDESVLHINITGEAHLVKDDASTPCCDFSFDYSYLNEEGDSIAEWVNRQVQHEILGEEFATLPIELAVDSFKNTFVSNYRNEVGPLYRMEVEKAISMDEIPPWFTHTYSLVTSVDEGYNGTILVTADTFLDLGGAHPSQWSRWLNFDFATGKLITREEVFAPEAQADIERMLFEALLAQKAKEHADRKLETLEDLQEIGILQWSNMYIPENFLLGKDGVSFLFNRYDIAPYSEGSIMLELPYGEIGAYLKR